MALKNYGLLKGRVVSFDGERTDSKSPHMEIMIEGGGKRFRAAVNVKSAEKPSEVVYFETADFKHPQLALYPDKPAGFTALERKAGSGALDFIRGNLFDFEKVVALPANAPGRDDDLLDKLELHLQRAQDLGDEADIYVFGEPFPDGIHDVHMNQGSIGQFASSNGVWQDGGVLIHDRGADRWTAVFLAFQSEAIHTDDRTGNAIPGSATFADIVAGKLPDKVVDQPKPDQPKPDQPKPAEPEKPTTPAPDGLVRIIAALVNPKGQEDKTGGETVTVINTGAAPVALGGWTLATSAASRMTLSDTVLKPGDALRIVAKAPFVLSNKGSIISLLDRSGTKVHGVQYTRDQAQVEGLTITF